MDHQHWDIGNPITPLRVQLPQLDVQGFERFDVLLDDDNDGLFEIVKLSAALVGGLLVEIRDDIGERNRAEHSRILSLPELLSTP